LTDEPVLRWLATLPDGLVFVIFGAIAIGLTFLFDVVTRHYVKPETRQRASATASVTLQVTATIYAILIAFVIVDAYSAVGDAQSQVSAKAASLAVVFENSRGLPKADGDEVRAATLRYARSVVDRGLPHLRDAVEPDRATDRLLEQLFRKVQGIQPQGLAQRTAYDSIVHGMDEIVSTRSKLLDAARPTVPSPLLMLLVVIGLVVMAVATLLDTQHRGSHLFILSALALVIWLTIALVISLDYPFSGLIRVTDEPIRGFIHFRAAR
jgi:hypothetical protein